MMEQGIELDVYSRTNKNQKIGALANRLNPQFLEELREEGGASFQLRTDDPVLLAQPYLIDLHNYVKIKVAGVEIGVVQIDSVSKTIVGDGEAAEEIWEISGKGLTAPLKTHAKIRPYGGVTPKSSGDRSFNFASPRGPWYVPGEWVQPVTIAPAPPSPETITAETVPDPANPYSLLPQQWGKARAGGWIWDRPSLGGAPVGWVYFRREFTNLAEGQYRLHIAADDAYVVYLDGEEAQSNFDEYAHATKRDVDFDLNAGDHVLGIKVYNRGGPAGMITAFWKVGDPTVEDSAELLTYSGDGSWLMHAYPAEAPGWTVGEVANVLGPEAAGRGVRIFQQIPFEFSNSHDSDGKPFDQLEWPLSVADEYSRFWDQAIEMAATMSINPATMGLRLHVDRGTHRDGTTATKPVVLNVGYNVQAAAESTSSEGMTNSILMETAEGWMVVEGGDANFLNAFGVIESSIPVNDLSTDLAGKIANRTLELHAREIRGTTLTILDPNLIPWRDIFVGDWVLGPNATGGHEPRRIVSLACAEDGDTGRVVYEIELDTISEDQLSKLDRWVKRMSNGNADRAVASGNGSRPSSTNQNENPPPDAPGDEPPGDDGSPGFPTDHGEFQSILSVGPGGIPKSTDDVYWRLWSDVVLSLFPQSAVPGWTLSAAETVGEDGRVHGSGQMIWAPPDGIRSRKFPPHRFENIVIDAGGTWTSQAFQLGPFALGVFRTLLSSTVYDFVFMVEGSSDGATNNWGYIIDELHELPVGASNPFPCEATWIRIKIKNNRDESATITGGRLTAVL